MNPEKEPLHNEGVDPENVWHALTQMLDVGKFFRTYCYRSVVEFGFSINEFDVMMALRQHPEKNTVKGISETAHLSKGIISQAVESLRKKQIVSVRQDEKDRRSLLITLENMAQPVLEKMKEAAADFAKMIMSGIPTEQLSDIFGIVTQVYSNKEKLSLPEPRFGKKQMIGGAALAADAHE